MLRCKLRCGKEGLGETPEKGFLHSSELRGEEKETLRATGKATVLDTLLVSVFGEKKQA